MRLCAFCEAPADSAEDALPKWLLKLMFPEGVRVTFTADRLGAPLRVEEGEGRRFEVKVGFVCERCNGGWMSKMEDDAKALFPALIHGGPSTIGADAQTFITQWAVKTAMALEYTRVQKVYFYMQEERTAMRDRRAVPEATVVWLASRSVAHSMNATARYLRSTIVPTAGAFEGYASTFYAGHLMIQVLTVRTPEVDRSVLLRFDVKPGPWPLVTVPIWPNLRADLNWPIPHRLDEDWLGTFETRWRGPDDSGETVT